MIGMVLVEPFEGLRTAMQNAVQCNENIGNPWRKLSNWTI
jgi:hypothetical protein